jgi:hypothetical protein
MLGHATNAWVTVAIALAAPFLVLVWALRLVRPETLMFADKEVEVRYRYVDGLFTRSIIEANLIDGLLMLNSLSLAFVIAMVGGVSWSVVAEMRESIGQVAQQRFHFPRLSWH